MRGVEKLVPELRFPEYENEWESKKLKFVLRNSRIKGGDASLTIFSVTQRHGLVPRESLDRKMADCANVSDNLQIQPKDLVYNMMRMWQGAIGLSYWNGMVSPAYIVLRPTKDVCSEFIINFFNRSRSLYLFWAYSYGVTNDRLRLYYKDFASISLAIPTLSEQKKIASFLSAVDKKIEKLTRKKELLETYKKGVMQKIFSRESRFKDENGKDFPDWEEKRLGEICDVRDGTHETPQYVNKGFPLITSKNLLNDGSIDYCNVDLISQNDYDSINKRSKVSIGDILFGMIGTIGNPVIVEKSGFAIKNVALIKEEMKFKNAFLIYFLHSAKILKQFYEQNTGGTQKFIALGVIRKLQIDVPTAIEQKKIADFLSSIDKKIKAVQTQLTQTQEFKKGLLQKMFV